MNIGYIFGGMTEGQLQLKIMGLLARTELPVIEVETIVKDIMSRVAEYRDAELGKASDLIIAKENEIRELLELIEKES